MNIAALFLVSGATAIVMFVLFVFVMLKALEIPRD
jgi:hypothetical protein